MSTYFGDSLTERQKDQVRAIVREMLRALPKGGRLPPKGTATEGDVLRIVAGVATWTAP